MAHGEISGFPEGTLFLKRVDLCTSGIHRPILAGIGANANGAESIILSGGYEDDQDDGDVIVYTGQGGNDPHTKKQVGDQMLTKSNAALARSMEKELPVRVVRGANGLSGHAPEAGYRYDGLFRVHSFWSETGKSGFRIWRFRLVKITNPSLEE